jgi:hypothetical protein
MFPNPTKIKHFKWWPKDGFTNIKGTQILTKFANQNISKGGLKVDLQT